MSGAAPMNGKNTYLAVSHSNMRTNGQSRSFQWNTKAYNKCYLLFPQGNKPVRNDDSDCNTVVECHVAPGFVVHAPLLTAVHIGTVQFHENSKEKIEDRIN